MQPLSLGELAAQKLDEARAASSGRSSVTLYGGREHRLRQTLLAMKAGTGLAEHESPGEATLHVLTGHIVLRTREEHRDLRAGDFIVLPETHHSVDVPEDSTFLLTVSLRGRHTD